MLLQLLDLLILHLGIFQLLRAEGKTVLVRVVQQ
jgi:hypothetical protein